MNLILRLFLAIFVGVMLALGFTIPAMDLLERPQVEQVLLVLFSAAAFGYLAFEIFGPPLEIAEWWRALQINGRWPSRSGFLAALREHAPGIILALLFWGVYLYIGFRLNSPTVDTTDNLLDADNFTWMQRISAPDGSQIEMRGPHPFAYFIFRPLGWLLNLFTRNPYLSAVLLNTFMGALCVFLAWAFLKHRFQDKVYALLFSALLGLSTAHMVLGSIVESYIFSAAALLGFFLLLETRKENTGALVVMSLLTFGITLTNFVQNFIGFVVARPRLRDMIRFGGLVVSFGVMLSMVHSVWYPSAKLFFLPSDTQAEQEFTISIFGDPAWRAWGRVLLLIRTVLLYTSIAPLRPYVFGADTGDVFPRFNFFKIAPGEYLLSSYDGFANILVFAWALALLVSGVVFLRNLIVTRKTDLALAFALSLLFNFSLHLNYGYEPFLYAPDWAYALVFFVAFGLAPFARQRWFQAALLVFLILLAYNQWQFFNFIFETVAPFLS